jgi:hypothetical protein
MICLSIAIMTQIYIKEDGWGLRDRRLRGRRLGGFYLPASCLPASCIKVH